MNGSIEWVIGTVLAIVAMLGGAVVRDRQVFKAIRDGDEKLGDKLTTGDKALDDRIDKTRDDYVRRADLEQHIKHLETSVAQLQTSHGELAREMRDANAGLVSQMNTRFDNLLAVLHKKDPA